MENAIPESEVLVGIATLGLTLTGFSGLVAVMGRRRDGQWTTGERFQFFQLAAVSLAVTFAAFVPVVVSTALAPEMTLRVSNGIIAIVHLACLSYGLSSVVRSPETRNAYARGMVLFMISGGFLLICAAIGSALDLIDADALILLLNLLWMFFVATVNFVQLLNSRESS